MKREAQIKSRANIRCFRGTGWKEVRESSEIILSGPHCCYLCYHPCLTAPHCCPQLILEDCHFLCCCCSSPWQQARNTVRMHGRAGEATPVCSRCCGDIWPAARRHFKGAAITLRSPTDGDRGFEHNNIWTVNIYKPWTNIWQLSVAKWASVLRSLVN